MTGYKLLSSYSKKNGIEFNRVEELQGILYNLSRLGNSIFLLEIPDFGIQTIGVGFPYGFVEYESEEKRPPYLIAKQKPWIKGDSSFIEYVSGGTSTPIPQEYCLPFNCVVDIVAYCLRDKQLPDHLRWVAV
jgi:hypothetical protein